jgi:hypothetical protein
VLTVTRKQQLLEAFRTAGRRGLTAREMQREVGVMWRLRLGELRSDGYTFCDVPSRLQPGKTFRWVLVLEPRPDGDSDDVDDIERLLDPPPSPPGNAIGGDLR